MERDMDLIRRIALEVTKLPIGESLQSLDGVPNDKFALHAIWMKEAGLIKAAVNESLSDTPYAFIFRLTWEGCEFADAVRDEGVWKRATESILKPSMSFSFSILKEWLKVEIQRGLPTFGGGV